MTVMHTPRIYARFPFYNMMNTEDGAAHGLAESSPAVTAGRVGLSEIV